MNGVQQDFIKIQRD